MITKAQAEALVNENNGVCPHCASKIKIYRYRVNKQIVYILKKMYEAQTPDEPGVNFTNLDMPYRLGTQRTKMRLHGLIVRVRNADGTKMADTWRITTKGFNFLQGVPIEEVVVVFANQVIGHEGRLVTIVDVTGEAGDMFGVAGVTPTESRVYHDVRKSIRDRKYEAAFVGRSSHYQTGETYIIATTKIQMGQPIMVRIAGVSNSEVAYKDIAEFQRNWKIIGEVQE